MEYPVHVDVCTVNFMCASREPDHSSGCGPLPLTLLNTTALYTGVSNIPLGFWRSVAREPNHTWGMRACQ
jgi:hypothetical protein